MRLTLIVTLLALGWMPACASGGESTNNTVNFSSVGSTTVDDGTGDGDGDGDGDAECGDGQVGGSEECDGSNLDGQSCADFGFGQGAIACGQDCKIASDGCFSCGDDVKSPAEACDGDDFGGESCQSLGFGGGDLICANGCMQINTAGCEPLQTCGNAKLDNGEQCDGNNLNGNSCQNNGFDGGSISCKQDCTLDLSQCTKMQCKQSGELCEFYNDDPFDSNCCMGWCHLAVCVP